MMEDNAQKRDHMDAAVAVKRWTQEETNDYQESMNKTAREKFIHLEMVRASAARCKRKVEGQAIKYGTCIFSH